MRQMIKRFLWIALLASGSQAAWAFSLGGPIGNGPDAWQVPVIGYGLGGDLVAPKNLGEEYRRNTPVMYYACNASFLDYFGLNGVAAVDGAFAILNNVFTNNSTGMTNGLDGYSPSLSEFPLNSQAINYQAQALQLLDLKSVTMGAMCEQLGLAEPERYIWTLHDRYQPPSTTCPFSTVYLVVMRNFDPTPTPLNVSQYSDYVNDTLYTYVISEFCTGPNPLAVTVPIPMDPLADTFTAVAGNGDGLQFGGFYTDLTRDDAGGLKYLLSSNNINFESPALGSILTGSTSIGVTNLGPPVLLYTSNYTAFWLSARTNDPVTLSNLFPGLVIVNSSFYFTNIATPIVVAYFTNLIGAPFGSPPVLVVKTNGYTYSFQAIYSDTFANLVISNRHPNTSASLMTVTVGVQIGAPYGSPLVTNTTTKTVTLTNVPSGEYYINTNYLCGPPHFLSTLATNVTAMTNLLFAGSNSAGFFTSQSLVTYSTSHVYVVQWPICASSVPGGVTNGPALYPGIQKIKFVRADFDSLLGQLFQPITNTYTMVVISGSKAQSQTFLRVVTTPDFTFAAADLASGPDARPTVPWYRRNLNFNTANVYPGLAGPGTIDPSTTITFDKVGPVYLNIGTSFLNGPNYGRFFIWGSFDGTTNDPVVYPNGTSIANLANAVLIQIFPASLPVGTSGISYPSTQFTTTGGAFTPPFTWSLPLGSALPPGLTLSPNGTISGTPTQSGTFDFTVQLNDALTPPRTVQWSFSITIN
jgi:hypothetical protein